MNYTLFFSVLAFFACIYVWIGKYASKNLNNNQDYFLGKRSFGAFSLTLTLLATQLGGGSLIGAAQEAYSRGWVVLLYPLGISLGLIALASGFGKKMNMLKLNTIAELFERVYGSKLQRKTVSVISIITMFFILIGQSIATRQFFLSIGVTSTWIFLFFWGIVILYTVIGGLKAVVYTDVVQTIFIIAVFILVLIFGVTTISPGATQMKAVSFNSSIPWSGWLLMPLLFMLIEQDMGQRCFAAKSSKVVKIAGICSAVLLFLCSIFAIYFGILAKKMNIDILPGSSVLMTCITKLTPSFVSSLFACGFLMVIISTADSLLCSIGSNLSFDFSFFQKKDKVKFSQLTTFLFGGLAVLGSYYFNKIVFLFILSYEFSVCILFVPTIAALFQEKLPKRAAYISMLF